MSTNFHVRDLLEFLKYVQESNKTLHNFMDFQIPYEVNKKTVDSIMKRYPLENKDGFLIIPGFEQGPHVNFFKIYDNEIVLSLSLSDSDEVFCTYSNWNVRFCTKFDINKTLNAMFKQICFEYVKSANIAPVNCERYIEQIECLSKFITRLLKIYTDISRLVNSL